MTYLGSCTVASSSHHGQSATKPPGPMHPLREQVVVLKRVRREVPASPAKMGARSERVTDGDPAGTCPGGNLASRRVLVTFGFRERGGARCRPGDNLPTCESAEPSTSPTGDPGG